MTTIKSFTDLSQSKTLSKILPLESADMCYVWDYERKFYTPEFFSFIQNQDNEGVEHIDYPCWSLAALLGILQKYELNNLGDTIQLDVNLEALATEGDETLLDLVVNMIIHLHELNLL